MSGQEQMGINAWEMRNAVADWLEQSVRSGLPSVVRNAVLPRLCVCCGRYAAQHTGAFCPQKRAVRSVSYTKHAKISDIHIIALFVAKINNKF